MDISVFVGDANSDGGVDLADAITILGYQFQGKDRPVCFKAADANNDGGVNLADAITVLNYQFQSGSLTAPDGTALGSCVECSPIGCIAYLEADVEEGIEAPACETPCAK